MHRILLQFLILFTNFFLICNYSFASSWKYLGYANVESGEIFYVFVDKKNSKLSGNEKNIFEKHVFNNSQKIAGDKDYMSIEIERILNCNEKKILTSKVNMFDSNGNSVATFTQTDKNLYTKILNKNDVNYSIFKEFCDNKP